MIFGVVVLLVALATVWFLVPTLRTFAHPAFQPVNADEASVFYAQSTGVEHAGI